MSTIPSSHIIGHSIRTATIGSNHFAPDRICSHSVAVRNVVGIVVVQQWLWLTVSDKAESSDIITLYQSGRMEWRNEMNTGRWKHERDTAIDQGFFLSSVQKTHRGNANTFSAKSAICRQFSSRRTTPITSITHTSAPSQPNTEIQRRL